MISVFAVMGFLTALAALAFATEGLRRVSQRSLDLEIALDAANRRSAQLESEIQSIKDRRGSQSRAFIELEKALRDQGLSTPHAESSTSSNTSHSGPDPMEAMLHAHQKSKKNVA